MHHYHFLLKLTILLGVIVCLNQILRVSFSLNFLRWIRRMPAWLSAAVQSKQKGGVADLFGARFAELDAERLRLAEAIFELHIDRRFAHRCVEPGSEIGARIKFGGRV